MAVDQLKMLYDVTQRKCHLASECRLRDTHQCCQYDAWLHSSAAPLMYRRRYVRYSQTDAVCCSSFLRTRRSVVAKYHVSSSLSKSSRMWRRRGRPTRYCSGVPPATASARVTFSARRHHFNWQVLMSVGNWTAIFLFTGNALTRSSVQRAPSVWSVLFTVSSIVISNTELIKFITEWKWQRTKYELNWILSSAAQHDIGNLKWPWTA